MEPRDWDAIYRETPTERISWEEGKPTTELVRLLESGVVEKGPALDVGMGTGNNAVYFAEQGFECHCIDISEAAVALAREKAERAGFSCEFQQGDAVDPPYSDDSFAFVFDRGCFHVIPPEDREPFILGIHRVLKPGGKYQMMCFSKDGNAGNGGPDRFSPEDIRYYFSPLFHIDSIREVDSSGKRLLSVLMTKVELECPSGTCAKG